jgi:hypothetical protein
MGSNAMIYIPNFIKIGSGNEKLMRRGSLKRTYKRYEYKETQLFKKKKKCSTLHTIELTL